MKRVRLDESDFAKRHELDALQCIQKIKEGTLNPRNLSTETRHACVEHLHGEGCTVLEIAHLFKVSDRTIARDLAQIRKNNSLERDPRLGHQIAGQRMKEGNDAINRIRRAVRGKQVSASVSIDAEHRRMQILDQLAERLQKLGWLPTAPTQIEADLRSQGIEMPDYEQLTVEIDRLIQVSLADETKREYVKKFKQLKATLMHAQVASELSQLQDALSEGKRDET